MFIQKDTKNVVATISLIAVVLGSGAVFYTKLVREEEEALIRKEETRQKELFAQSFLEIQLSQLSASSSATTTPVVETKPIEETPVVVTKKVPVPVAPVPTPTPKPLPDTSVQDAQIAAQKAQEAALAKQLADAKAAAEKLAAEKAATTIKPSRQSQAS